MNKQKIIVPEWFHEKVSFEREFIVRDIIDAWIISEIVVTKLYVENPKKKKKKQEPYLFDKDNHDYVADNFRDLVSAVLGEYDVKELEE